MKKLFIFFLLVTFPAVGFSQTNSSMPHWSFELKGGNF